MSTKEYENSGTKDEFYIALALPNLSGKTQMAFNIRSKRPLYFAIKDDNQINSCFYEISSKFKRLLIYDLFDEKESLTAKNCKGSSDMDIGSVVNFKHFRKYFLDQKFQSLGFLVAVAKKCEKLYKESTNDEWMEFFANNQKHFESLQCEPISIAELEAQEDFYKCFLEKYFIFIDDYSFEGFDSSMIRTICSYLKMPCVLASSNPKIANIDSGRPLTVYSESSRPSVHCAAFSDFPTLSEDEIEYFLKKKSIVSSFLNLPRTFH